MLFRSNFNVTSIDACGNNNSFVAFPTGTLSNVNFGGSFPSCIKYYKFDTDASAGNFATGSAVADASFVGTTCSQSTSLYKIGTGSIVNTSTTTNSFFSFANPTIPVNANGFSVACWFYLTQPSQTGYLWSMNNALNAGTNRIYEIGRAHV